MLQHLLYAQPIMQPCISPLTVGFWVKDMIANIETLAHAEYIHASTQNIVQKNNTNANSRRISCAYSVTDQVMFMKG